MVMSFQKQLRDTGRALQDATPIDLFHLRSLMVHHGIYYQVQDVRGRQNT